ncbi:ribosomal RNA small subunit methyltransferase G [Paenibacillus baekrokdamisoli]|uniref:Ribosomal RNA small subunit methyltransferase G n=1 Tax=Paenibacillus baekrokdamisoli TaxID=1712516 RepID=A0A3G9JBV3_9BACL|nr:16S rRNA (guanine(527)-N(7))-methyltransferase RsmG [Paenibacillus baekrokdamisoli]MBB3068557.1 16S rRNA (guanine527-N7)-methyltransferase [Paenibacillus baekrokdamisoli]BBH23391.1 ribosomal RNA small subunit methyltransferase G [Paenibacillus baekrokdamisoli]
MNQTEQWFSELLSEHGITLSEEQLHQFDTYYRLLVEWNEKMNLTGITEREAVYEKHFYDSISLAFVKDMTSIKRLADIGSGAGFPSIPLKICFPDLHITIVDSLNKRIQFLQHLVTELKLEHVECVHGRAEDIGRLLEHRDSYDLVTARAVARLAALNELCLPFVRKHGVFAAMKGADPADELKEAKRSMFELKAKPLSSHHLKLPFEQSDRHLILIEKTSGTPSKYPRKAGLPLKQPLI